ncbi:MAG: binding-protein-dependent transport system inner rane component [Thermomicrobiales bacterium]|jgi:peptide/nickel transport system permease protein|nr:binding-protein-dependent transport system inner rane component [Thermomicrobiales bacterium]MDF3041467.1 binding-protein-dependent transport system inner rane component [Thermomicrobiales bacterium]
MTAYIIRRLLAMIPIIIGVTFLTFAIINLMPGSPVLRLRDNPKIRPEAAAELERQLGLDKPWPQRYVTWLGDLARGDLGVSLYNRLPVADRIWSVIPNTLLLAVVSLVFALMIAVPLGVYAAVRHRSLFDHFATVSGVAMYAIPDVWLALVLVWIFALQANKLGLPSLPVGGMTDPRGGGDFLDRVQHMILPVIALSLAQIGGWSAIIRSSMLEVLSNDYIRTAKSKGLSDRVVYYVHGFKPAFITLLTLIGLALPGLIGGAIIIETIFAWPGMGRLTFEAIGRRDYTMIMATTLMFAMLTMLSNLLTDIAYVRLDPRIRLD